MGLPRVTIWLCSFSNG